METNSRPPASYFLRIFNPQNNSLFIPNSPCTLSKSCPLRIRNQTLLTQFASITTVLLAYGFLKYHKQLKHGAMDLLLKGYIQLKHHIYQPLYKRLFTSTSSFMPSYTVHSEHCIVNTQTKLWNVDICKIAISDDDHIFTDDFTQHLLEGLKQFSICYNAEDCPFQRDVCLWDIAKRVWTYPVPFPPEIKLYLQHEQWFFCKTTILVNVFLEHSNNKHPYILLSPTTLNHISL